MKLFLLLAVLSDCRLADADRAFMAAALQTWDEVRTQDLQLESDARLPRVLFFDERCVFEGTSASAHGGVIKVPNGNEIPARAMAFAGSYDGGKPFLVQALPPVWRAEQRHRDNPALDRLMRSVFVHEMTHTVQTRAFDERLTELEARHKIEALDDDIVQTRFASNAEFAAAFKEERDLLYAIAAQPDARLRREAAKEAVRLAKARRARFFTGDSRYLAELEEIFLGMEGAAQWAAFRAAIRDGATREEALDLVNKGARRWSQDEGLALFLAIDALMPGKWQKKVFGEKPTPVWKLLEQAAR
ncbi:MAG TPA: hypothetical protein VGF28_04835 [Thermoanaerobaculia bacterium]|jgi:hypothetical protein